MTGGGAGRRAGRWTAWALALVVLTGCADFSTEPPPVTIQPSLSPAEMHPQTESAPLPTSDATATASPPTDTPPSGTTTGPQDPCRPADQAIIAACLTTPWGLAVLPGGLSAVVGERTTGRILVVAPKEEPVPVAQVDGLDSTGDGGLLGIALSPHFVEDGLIYAYVTTDTDNRIVRIAQGDTPKPIFTGIPKGATHNGGRIAFGADGLLYIATGDAGVTGAGRDTLSLAGKVLRIDEFGKPAAAEQVPVPSTTSQAPTTAAEPTTTEAPPTSTESASPGPDATAAIFATGLANPTGICPLAQGIGVVDRVGTADLLTVATAGADLSSATPLWSFPVTDGGAVDCAQTETVLGATSLDAKHVTALALASGGGFTGQPTQLAKDMYGRLLTLEAGSQGLFWATTSNKDGFGQPQPRDDLVVVIPDGGGGGGGDSRD